MPRAELLVFTTCFNERENIGLLIDQIAAELPGADILVVDDNSPDGTWKILLEKKQAYPQLWVVQRPRKMGIGSAHKYALLYAIRNQYETLITLDADFSHDPKYLRSLLAAHDENVFVTGSRYCKGGRSDYTGYRNVISRLGNSVARIVIGAKIRELTTYYRVFDVNSLRRLPLRKIKSNGYSYGVQLIYYLKKAGVKLREVPIHFMDRTRGSSKIPRFQILLSAIDLVKLGVHRLIASKDLLPDVLIEDTCANCGDRALAMKHAGSPEEFADSTEATYRCTSGAGASARSYPPVYRCLRCGLEQVPASRVPRQLECLYEDVVDNDYLRNADARGRTFARALDQIEGNLVNNSRRMLEVGAYCGIFGEAASRRGWDYEGIEPSRWAAEYARNVYGLRVHAGPISANHDVLKSEYDIIVAWDVLEHVRDPLAFVRECAGRLSANGLFCFSTLDIDSWFPAIAGRRWPWLMDMHLHYFDRHVVKDLLSRAGLKLLKTEKYTHYARLGYAIHGMARTLPTMLRKPIEALASVVPNGLLVPIAMGDIKMYVARRVDRPEGEGAKDTQSEAFEV